MPELETQAQFRSFDEAAGALTMELENLKPGPEFPADQAFEILTRAIELKTGDEGFEAQKTGVLRDLISQRSEYADKYRSADETGKQKIIESLKNSLNNYIKLLGRR